MKEKILLYGGAFDPPHQGHIHLLSYAIRVIQPNQTIVIPTGVPAHKQMSTTPMHHRIALCECLTQIADHVEIDARELKKQQVCYTIDTLQEMMQEHPDAEIFLLIGADMFLSFESWKEYENILNAVCLIVQARMKGQEQAMHQMVERLRQKGARIVVLQEQVMEVSSTQLRQMIQEGKDFSHMVSKQTADYIQEHQLYQKKLYDDWIELVQLYAKQHLSEQRWQHTVGVAKQAKKLAKCYDICEKRALLAAFLHDAAKEMPKEEMQEMIANAPEFAAQLDMPVVTWHAAAAAVLGKNQFGITDEEVLSAVACHTTGKEQMTTLEQILYLADMTSEERSFPGVEALRDLAFENLQQAMLMGLSMTLEHLQQSGKIIAQETLKAYEDFKQNIVKNNILEIF